MRFVVYGAGAIGGVVGARLHQSGQDVTLVARGEHLAEIRANGLTVEDDRGVRTLRITAVEDPADAHIGAEDTVVLALKSQHTSGALDVLARAADPRAAIVCAQNGIDNERQALRRFPRVYGARVSCLATHLRPGLVQAHSTPVAGSIDLGCYPSGVDEHAAAIVGRLCDAGFDAAVTADIMAWKRRKLLVNLGTAVEALCGSDTRQGELTATATEEGRAVFAAAGLGLPSPDDVVARAPTPTRVAIPHGGGSSWQSLRRGSGSIESDFINGEIVLLGRLYGVPTPANAVIQAAAREAAATAQSPGSVDESALLRRLERP